RSVKGVARTGDEDAGALSHHGVAIGVPVMVVRIGETRDLVLEEPVGDQCEPSLIVVRESAVLAVWVCDLAVLAQRGVIDRERDWNLAQVDRRDSPICVVSIRDLY